MEHQQALGLIGVLAAAFPGRPRTREDPGSWSPETVAVYAAALGPLEFHVAELAVHRVLSTYTGPGAVPMIGHVVEAYRLEVAEEMRRQERDARGRMLEAAPATPEEVAEILAAARARLHAAPPAAEAPRAPAGPPRPPWRAKVSQDEARDCPRCGGSGQDPDEDRPCWRCEGDGWLRVEEPDVLPSPHPLESKETLTFHIGMAHDRPMDDAAPTEIRHLHAVEHLVRGVCIICHGPREAHHEEHLVTYDFRTMIPPAPVRPRGVEPACSCEGHLHEHIRDVSPPRCRVCGCDVEPAVEIRVGVTS